MKSITIRLASLLFVGLLMTGCASTQMNAIPKDQLVTKPEPGKALVYFVRATSFGGAIQAPLFDDDQYIGTSSAKTIVPYQATPGAHMFMVVGESADFLQAELLPDKTYYAEVTPRIGAWKARFSLRPQNGQITDKQISGWEASCKQVKPNDKGFAWAKQNAGSVQKLKQEYLPKWQSKDNVDKQILRAESGK